MMRHLRDVVRKQVNITFIKKLQTNTEFDSQRQQRLTSVHASTYELN